MSGLTAPERHVMAHTTAWHVGLYRNHFCASEGHDDWPVLVGLCERGLMRVARGPSELSGGDTVFAVTAAGVEALAVGDVVGAARKAVALHRGPGGLEDILGALDELAGALDRVDRNAAGSGVQP